MWRTPVGRGFIMLAAMSACLGFAMNAHTNIVTNYFEDVLKFSGPQFGYITAIREVGGFVLIFLTALFYRVSLQKVTAGAMLVLGVGYAFFSVAGGFLTVIPWVLVTSFGFHTVLQTQSSLAMDLTTQDRSGAVLGQMGAFIQAGTFVAYAMVLVTFLFHWLNYRSTFVILGIIAVLGGAAILGFPHLHEGQVREVAPKREPIVLRRDYRYYYWLNVFDGARQQIFFSFGLWVMVNRFHFGVARVSLLLMVATLPAMLATARLGRWIDRRGERGALSVVNLWYVVALAGFALAPNLWMASFFYIVYNVITPLSTIGGATYLRKIAVPEDIAPSLAMGVTLMHATAIVVPVVAGVILHYTGYQVPFFIACGFAVINFAVTLRLDPRNQRCAARVALDETAAGDRLVAEVAARETLRDV